MAPKPGDLLLVATLTPSPPRGPLGHYERRAAEMKTERDAAIEEVKRLRDMRVRTFCAYCECRIPGHDDDAKIATREHIATCPKHPMRVVEAERDRLQRLLKTRSMVRDNLAEMTRRLCRERDEALAEIERLRGDNAGRRSYVCLRSRLALARKQRDRLAKRLDGVVSIAHRLTTERDTARTELAALRLDSDARLARLAKERDGLIEDRDRLRANNLDGGKECARLFYENGALRADLDAVRRIFGEAAAGITPPPRKPKFRLLKGNGETWGVLYKDGRRATGLGALYAMRMAMEAAGIDLLPEAGCGKFPDTYPEDLPDAAD